MLADQEIEARLTSTVSGLRRGIASARGLHASLRSEAKALDNFIPMLVEGARSGITSLLKHQVSHAEASIHLIWKLIEVHEVAAAVCLNRIQKDSRAPVLRGTSAGRCKSILLTTALAHLLVQAVLGLVLCLYKARQSNASHGTRQ